MSNNIFVPCLTTYFMRLFFCSLDFSIKVFFHNNSERVKQIQTEIFVANIKHNQKKNYIILFLDITKVLKNTVNLVLERDRETPEKVQDLLQLLAEKRMLLSNKNKFKFSNMLFLTYFSLKIPYVNILIAKIIL